MYSESCHHTLGCPRRCSHLQVLCAVGGWQQEQYVCICEAAEPHALNRTASQPGSQPASKSRQPHQQQEARRWDQATLQRSSLDPAVASHHTTQVPASCRRHHCICYSCPARLSFKCMSACRASCQCWSSCVAVLGPGSQRGLCPGPLVGPAVHEARALHAAWHLVPVGVHTLT